MEKRNGKALLPIFVFVVLYLGLGILFEYGLRIEMGFYKIPVVVIFLIALLVACLQNRALPLNDKLAVMGTGISDPNIITMILIFMLAGIFVGVVGRSSANSVAYFILSLIPPQFAVAVLFIVSCLVSLAMGTSVGTITLIVPIGIAVAKASGFSVPLCIASVMSGAMFGDNLSSFKHPCGTGAHIAKQIGWRNHAGCNHDNRAADDTDNQYKEHIQSHDAANQYQNIGNGLNQVIFFRNKAAIIAFYGKNKNNDYADNRRRQGDKEIFLKFICHFTALPVAGSNGCIRNTSMVAILVAAICALIKEYGGFAALLHWIKQVFKGRRGGLLGMGLLVGLMDIATANNTVAIVMANPIAKEMSKDYGISSRKAASILDTFSCVFQGILPYGAQMLVAIAAASGLGETVNAFEIMPKLFYPYMLLISSLLFIFFGKEKQK